MRSKTFRFFAVVMIAALVLGACAKTTEVPTEAPVVEETEAPVVEETEAPVVEETTEPVVEGIDWSTITPATEIVFWHQHTGSAREAAMAQIVSDFNATNEYGITLTAEYAGGYGDIFTKMLPILNTSDVPDIVVGYQNQIATYQLADSIFDLNELMDDPTYGYAQSRSGRFLPRLLCSGRLSSVWQSAPRFGSQPLQRSYVLQYGLAA